MIEREPNPGLHNRKFMQKTLFTWFWIKFLPEEGYKCRFRILVLQKVRSEFLKRSNPDQDFFLLIYILWPYFYQIWSRFLFCFVFRCGWKSRYVSESSSGFLAPSLRDAGEDDKGEDEDKGSYLLPSTLEELSLLFWSGLRIQIRSDPGVLVGFGSGFF